MLEEEVKVRFPCLIKPHTMKTRTEDVWLYTLPQHEMVVSDLLHTLVDNTSREGASLSTGCELQGPRFSLGLCREEIICNLYPAHSLVTVPTALSELPLERSDILQTLREVCSLHPHYICFKIVSVFITLRGQASFLAGSHVIQGRFYHAGFPSLQCYVPGVAKPMFMSRVLLIL